MYVNHNPFPIGGGTTSAPLHPNYQDELTLDQLAAIQHAVDPDGSRAADRKPIHSPGW